MANKSKTGMGTANTTEVMPLAAHHKLLCLIRKKDLKWRLYSLQAVRSAWHSAVLSIHIMIRFEVNKVCMLAIAVIFSFILSVFAFLAMPTADPSWSDMHVVEDPSHEFSSSCSYSSYVYDVAY